MMSKITCTITYWVEMDNEGKETEWKSILTEAYFASFKKGALGVWVQVGFRPIDGPKNEKSSKMEMQFYTS